MEKTQANSAEEISKSVGSIYSALLSKRRQDHEEKAEKRRLKKEEKQKAEDEKYTKEDGSKMSKKEKRKSDLERWESIIVGLTGDDLEYSSSKKSNRKKKYRKWIDDDINTMTDVKPKKVKKKNYKKEFEPELNMLRNLVSEQNKFTADLQKRFMNAAGPATKDAMLPNKTLVELASVISSGRSNSLGVLREIGSLKKTIADLYMKQKKLDMDMKGSGSVDERDLTLLGSSIGSSIFGSASTDFSPMDTTPQPQYSSPTTPVANNSGPIVQNVKVESFDPDTWEGPDIGNSYTKYENIPHTVIVEKNQATGDMRFKAVRNDTGEEIEGCPVPTSDLSRLVVNEKDMVVKGEFDEVYKLQYA